MPDHLVREAQNVLKVATNDIEQLDDGNRSAPCGTVLDWHVTHKPPTTPVCMHKLLRLSSIDMVCPCRTFECFEAVGLIFHMPDFIRACSQEDFEKPLKVLLQALETTQDKVKSRLGLHHACMCSSRDP